MTRDEVIALAKQCGHWSGETIEMNDVGIQRFANLIEQRLESTHQQKYESLVTTNQELQAALRLFELAQRRNNA